MLPNILRQKSKPANNVEHASEIESFPLTSDAYTITGFIGKGAFAKVYAANCISKSRTVAIKVILLEDEEEDGLYFPSDVKPVDINEIQKEASIMSSFNHENVVRCYASFVVNYELWLVMPFICGGSCGQIMRYIPEFKKGIKDHFILASILRDVISALDYIHNQGRMHRDVKGRNILLHENGNAMLADFGVSGALIEDGLRKQGRNTITGTPCWMSPEVMRQDRYNHKSDMWSLGITALELAFNTTPYTDCRSPMKVMKEITQGTCPTVDSMGDHQFHKSFQSMIGKLLVKDPTKRTPAKELLTCNFLKKFAVKDKMYIVEHIVNKTKSRIVKKCKAEDLPTSLQTEEVLKRRKSVKNVRIQVIDSEGKTDNDNNINNKQQSVEFSFSVTIDPETLVEDAIAPMITNASSDSLSVLNSQITLPAVENEIIRAPVKVTQNTNTNANESQKQSKNEKKVTVKTKKIGRFAVS